MKTHISLNVADIERSVTFYEAFFGVPAHKRRPGYANFDLTEPALKLALQERTTEEAETDATTDGPPLSRGSLNHLGIQVEAREMVDAARERLIAAGLATFDEGDVVCCYARQDKIWATDPDGNGWEIYFLMEDAEETVPPTSNSIPRRLGLPLATVSAARACCS